MKGRPDHLKMNLWTKHFIQYNRNQTEILKNLGPDSSIQFLSGLLAKNILPEESVSQLQKPYGLFHIFELCYTSSK